MNSDPRSDPDTNALPESGAKTAISIVRGLRRSQRTTLLILNSALVLIACVSALLSGFASHLVSKRPSLQVVTNAQQFLEVKDDILVRDLAARDFLYIDNVEASVHRVRRWRATSCLIFIVGCALNIVVVRTKVSGE